jgi:hypothetical protein
MKGIPGGVNNAILNGTPSIRAANAPPAGLSTVIPSALNAIAGRRMKTGMKTFRGSNGRRLKKGKKNVIPNLKYLCCQDPISLLNVRIEHKKHIKETKLIC